MTTKDNLIKCRDYYTSLLSEGRVKLVEFHTDNGQKHGISNPDGIKAILEAAITEINRQIKNY